ncbi:MAG: hypothetical protein ABSG04_15950, partial [Verrucomicrobiota bacterium]
LRKNQLQAGAPGFRIPTASRFNNSTRRPCHKPERRAGLIFFQARNPARGSTIASSWFVIAWVRTPPRPPSGKPAPEAMDEVRWGGKESAA